MEKLWALSTNAVLYPYNRYLKLYYIDSHTDSVPVHLHYRYSSASLPFGSADTATRDLRGTSADGKRISERSNPTPRPLSGARLSSSSLLVLRCKLDF